VIAALLDLLRSGKEWDDVYLEFCSAELDETVKAMTALYNVKRLEVAGNVDLQCMQLISNRLTTNTSLVEISLLVSLDGMKAMSLMQGIQANSTLRRLELIGSTLLPESITSLTEFLRSDGDLKTVHVDGCIVEDSDMAALVTSLKDHPRLRELYIDEHTSEESLRSAISNLIMRGTLFKLSLRSWKDAYKDSSAYETSWIVPALKTNTSLRILDLAENGIDDSGLEALVEVFRSNSTIQEVRLYDNHITNEGAELFGKSLRVPEMKVLKRMFFHRNRFDEVGGRYILEGVQINHKVEELSVPTLGRSKALARFQGQINYETYLNSGGKHLLRDRNFPLNLWPLVFERAGSQLWTPYCAYQMKSIAKWKQTQQADVVFHLIQNSDIFGLQ
jgi:hypothetical protein